MGKRPLALPRHELAREASFGRPSALRECFVRASFRPARAGPLLERQRVGRRNPWRAAIGRLAPGSDDWIVSGWSRGLKPPRSRSVDTDGRLGAAVLDLGRAAEAVAGCLAISCNRSPRHHLCPSFRAAIACALASRGAALAGIGIAKDALKRLPAAHRLHQSSCSMAGIGVRRRARRGRLHVPRLHGRSTGCASRKQDRR